MRLRLDRARVCSALLALAFLAPVRPACHGADLDRAFSLDFPGLLAPVSAHAAGAHADGEKPEVVKEEGEKDGDRPKPAETEDAKKEPAKPVPTVAASDALFGNSNVFSKPAEVDVDKVYAKIAEYVEITEKGIEASDPQHAILLAKASRKFNSAVRKAAKAGHYDLIAKRGTVKGLDSVTDLTDDVIDRL